MKIGVGKGFTTFILLLAIGVIALVYFWQSLPYQAAVANQISKKLAGYGIEVTSLKVESLTNKRAVLTDIELGKAPPLKIKRVTASYTLDQVRYGKLNTLKLDGARATLTHQSEGWKIGGLEGLKPSTSAGNTPFLFDSVALRRHLPEYTQLNIAQLSLNQAEKSIQIALEGEISLRPQIVLNLKTNGIHLDAKPYQLATSAFPFTLKFDEPSRQWQGKAQIEGIKIRGLTFPLPLLRLQSDFTLAEDRTQAQLDFRDKRKSYIASLKLNIPTAKPDSGSLRIQRLQFPWGGGRISAASFMMPLQRPTKPISTSLKLENIDLSELAEQFGGNQMEASGKINGVLPITYYPDGSIRIQKGTAAAQESGTLSLSPELLPGENKELELTRNLLKNFQYTRLEMGISVEKNEESAIRLSLAGRNPDVLNGKQVKLNITLTGDVLPMLRQSFLPFKDIKQLLESQDIL